MSHLNALRNFWEPFSKHYMRYLMVSAKRIHYSCEDGIEKSVPCDYTFCHHLASLGIPNGYHRVKFLSHPHYYDRFLYYRIRNISDQYIEDLTWVINFYWIYQTSWGKEIKCEAYRAFYLFFATSFINAINYRSMNVRSRFVCFLLVWIKQWIW